MSSPFYPLCVMQDQGLYLSIGRELTCVPLSILSVSLLPSRLAVALPEDLGFYSIGKYFLSV